MNGGTIHCSAFNEPKIESLHQVVLVFFGFAKSLSFFHIQLLWYCFPSLGCAEWPLPKGLKDIEFQPLCSSKCEPLFTLRTQKNNPPQNFVGVKMPRHWLLGPLTTSTSCPRASRFGCSPSESWELRAGTRAQIGPPAVGVGGAGSVRRGGGCGD